jgi:predicted alpha/beta-fold hydrolase
VPTLVVHALDDPWIPGAIYERVDWRANPRLVPLLPRRGGHLGFHARGSAVPWHDRAIAAFFAQRG